MLINSERCIIRDFENKDIDSFMDYRNDCSWMQYQGFKGLTKEEYKKALLGTSSIKNGKQFAIIDKTFGHLLGDIYLKQENLVFWLGYTINPIYARQGYIAEAVTSIIGWCTEQGATLIKAGVLPENTASINLLKKQGFNYSDEEEGELIFDYQLTNIKA